MKQADKLQSLISAAKVPDVEPIWCQLFAKALEGKDVKDLLLNVGSGGGAAAAAPAAGGAPAATEEAAPAAEEKKEEGSYICVQNLMSTCFLHANIGLGDRKGGVRRGYGFRSLRLDILHYSSFGKQRQRRVRYDVALPMVQEHGSLGCASSIDPLSAMTVECTPASFHSRAYSSDLIKSIRHLPLARFRYYTRCNASPFLGKSIVFVNAIPMN